MTLSSLPLPVHMVDNSSAFADLAAALSRQPRIAMDTESNGFFRYPERVCLIQLATATDIYLVDPLAVEDMTPLGPLLGDLAIEKVLHGADYDVRSLDREWGFRFRNLFDTGMAAHFIGMDRLGLGVLIEELLGKSVAKEKRLQRADWGVRPLSEEALAYAAEDVLHLFDLRRILGEKLATLERDQWVKEELARLADVRHSPQDVDTAFLHLKGAGGLGPKPLAVLKALWTFRDALARRHDRPPFRIMPDKALILLAEKPDTPLEEVPGLGSYAIQRWGSALRRALLKGMVGPLVFRPYQEREKVTPEELLRRQQMLKDLKSWRTEEGKRLSLDPSLLWPAISLERLARSPGTLEQEMTTSEVRDWQRQHIAPLLRASIALRP